MVSVQDVYAKYGQPQDYLDFKGNPVYDVYGFSGSGGTTIFRTAEQVAADWSSITSTGRWKLMSGSSMASLYQQQAKETAEAQAQHQKEYALTAAPAKLPSVKEQLVEAQANLIKYQSDKTGVSISTLQNAVSTYAAPNKLEKQQELQDLYNTDKDAYAVAKAEYAAETQTSISNSRGFGLLAIGALALFAMRGLK